MKKNYLLVLVFFKSVFAIAQAPNISYPTPNTFSVNETITPLTPTNTGGAIPNEPIVSTLAGTGAVGSFDGPISNAQFYLPTVVTLDNQNNIIVVDRSNHKIRKISNDETVSTIAGTGSIGSQNGMGNMATFNYPDGAIVDSQGNIFITDQSNHRIRKIDTNNQVSTFAGSGIAGYQDGLGLDAKFYYPAAMAIDANDNLYIADYSNHRIRKISPDGLVSTIAGIGSAGAADGPIATAQFNGPTGLCFDNLGNLFVADYGNHKIRKMDTNGQVTTFAGEGIAGNIDGNGASARFNHPAVVSWDGSAFYITDDGNHKIRKITQEGNVSTFAGTGNQGLNNDLASTASFKNPTGLVVNASKEIIIADYGNHVIRKIKSYTYSIVPNLPNGLQLNENTGAISGTPTTTSPPTDYTVTISNTEGTSSFMLNIEVGTLSTAEFQKESIQVYPNPIQDFVTIKAKSNIIKVEIYTLLGQLIQKMIPNQEQFQIDFSGIEKGIYILKLESNFTNNTIRVVKQE